MSINPLRHRSITDIVYVTAEHYGVSPSDIMGRKRSKTIAEARQVVYALCRDLTRASLPEIGGALGRDHTSVMAGISSLTRRAQKDQWLAKSLAVCRVRALEAVEARRMA